jgi:hypothetical protein
MPMILLPRLAIATAVAALSVAIAPADAEAQFPIGAAGRRGSGLPNQDIPSAPPRRKAPKSETLVPLEPFLRGIDLTDTQRSQVAALEEKYNPLMLPALDVVGEEYEKDKAADLERGKRYQARATRYRESQLEELRALLDTAQQERLARNIEAIRKRTGSLFAPR